jgi:hypothetical protein
MVKNLGVFRGKPLTWPTMVPIIPRVEKIHPAEADVIDRGRIDGFGDRREHPFCLQRTDKTITNNRLPKNYG